MKLQPVPAYTSQWFWRLGEGQDIQVIYRRMSEEMFMGLTASIHKNKTPLQRAYDIQNVQRKGIF
jgi:hypothetical protein